MAAHVPNPEPAPRRPASQRSSAAVVVVAGSVSLAVHAGVLMSISGLNVGGGALAEPVEVGEAFIERAARPIRRVADRDRRPTPERAPPQANARASVDGVVGPGPGAQLPSQAEPTASPEATAESEPVGIASGALAGALRAQGPGVSFAGLSASGVRARSVVYVVDASGPMVSSMPDVLSELERSIAGLAPTQRFGVVLFRDQGDTGGGPAAVSFRPRLIDANRTNREALRVWLDDQRIAGRSSPMAGLRAALELRPQVIFLLSRSIDRTGGGAWDLGLEATLAELDRLNPADPATGRRPVIIKTIQFIDEDPTGIMRAIARQHGAAAQAEPITPGGESAPRSSQDDHRVLRARDLQR
ncbi:MAG: hypothetical protein ACK5WB_11110 [Phycisphaerales bacterium]|jgi:hypothetical protein|nr:hypothetical protein [Phycisphaeraceae bacterium]